MNPRKIAIKELKKVVLFLREAERVMTYILIPKPK